MVILEDYDSSIYQENINTIIKVDCGLKILCTNNFDIKLSLNSVEIFDKDDGGHCPNMVVKEVWHRVDNETFKRIYTNSKLVGYTIDNNCVEMSDELKEKFKSLKDEIMSQTTTIETTTDTASITDPICPYCNKHNTKQLYGTATCATENNGYRNNFCLHYKCLDCGKEFDKKF